MTDHAKTVRAYYAAWLADDLDGVMALCTDDVVAVNVPIGPIEGKPAVRKFFAKFQSRIRDKRYEVHRVIANADSCVVEGVEMYVRDGRQVSLPYMSTFLFRDGLICEWRDYFDLKTLMDQLGLPLDASQPAAQGREASRA